MVKANNRVVFDQFSVELRRVRFLFSPLSAHACAVSYESAQRNSKNNYLAIALSLLKEKSRK